MREIVHNQNASVFALHIHSTLHAAKRCQSFGQRVYADAAPMRHRDGCCRVQHVVPASGRQRKFTELLAAMEKAEARHFAIHHHLSGDPIVLRRKSIRLHWTESFSPHPPQSTTSIL